MKARRRQTSGHPRVGCLVPGCTRGTTRIPAEVAAQGCEYICGLHWRRVPKYMKARLSRYKRRSTLDYRKGDEERAKRWQGMEWALWQRIRAELINPAEGADEIPMAMRAELEQVGIL